VNILVVGLGKLGLPLAAVIANAGYKVLGYDKSLVLVESLNNREFYSSEPGLLNLLKKNSKKLSFKSSISFQDLESIDVIFIIVPTPSLPNGAFSNEHILKIIDELGIHLKLKQTKTAVCIVSTVMPGSCDGEIRNRIENITGEILGNKIGLCYHPEFIALGSVIRNLQFPDYQLLGVSNDWVAKLTEKVFQSVVKHKVPCKKMTLLEAEIVKLSVNNYITMKISFANSLLQLVDHFENVKIKIVTEAIGLDSRIGTKYLTAGAPYGGPCFPRDTLAMSKLFRDASITNSYSELTPRINRDYTTFLMNKISNLVNETDKIGILGISYKMGTPVIDESPGVSIAKACHEKGMQVYSWDDENAKIPDGSILDLELDEILKLCDFFVITRDTLELNKINDYLNKNNKRYINFWNFK
jgi:UDPglucose 6-dehydrogenase